MFPTSLFLCELNIYGAPFNHQDKRKRATKEVHLMTVKCYTPGSTEFNPASGMWQRLHRAMPSVLTMSGSFHEYDRTASLNLVYPGEKKKCLSEGKSNSRCKLQGWTMPGKKEK